MRDQMMFSYEKFLGIHMFFFGRIMIAFSKRWQIGFIDWRRHDKVMCKSYAWKITEQEIETLEKAMTENDWNNACDKIKGARGGQYPEDLWQRVVLNGVMANFAKRSNWTS